MKTRGQLFFFVFPEFNAPAVVLSRNLFERTWFIMLGSFGGKCWLKEEVSADVIIGNLGVLTGTKCYFLMDSYYNVLVKLVPLCHCCNFRLTSSLLCALCHSCFSSTGHGYKSFYHIIKNSRKMKQVFEVTFKVNVLIHGKFMGNQLPFIYQLLIVSL